jgi:MscS family membrane protein
MNDGMTDLNSVVSSASYFVNNKYFFALAIFFFLVLIIKLVLMIAKNIILRIVSRTETEIDDIIVRRTETPIFITLIIVALKTAIVVLELPDDYLILYNGVLDSLLIAFVAYSIHIVTSVILAHYVKKIHHQPVSSFHSEVIPFANNFSKIFYAAIAVVFILRVWNVNVLPLLAGLGIAGITIGLALQNTLTNIIGGISLLLDHNFNIGDEVRLDNEIEGVVLDVGLRSTKVRTKNNELIIVPNNILANSKIINYAKPSTHLRIYVEFSMPKGSDIEKFHKDLVKKCSKIDFLEKHTLPETDLVSITNLDLKLRSYFWINLSHVNRNLAREKLSMVIYDITKSIK